MALFLDSIVSLEPFDHFYWAILLLVAGFFTGLGVLIFAARKRAEKFLGGFAATVRANSIESVLRFIVGVSLAGFAWQQGQYVFVAYIGLFVAISAIAMLLLPRLHRHFAKWAVPFTFRILPIYGLGSLLLGISMIVGLSVIRFEM